MKVTSRICITGQNEYDGSPQYSCKDVELGRNRHGNFSYKFEKVCPSFVSFFNRILDHVFVFDKLGTYISHRPSKKYKLFKVNAELIDLKFENSEKLSCGAK